MLRKASWLGAIFLTVFAVVLVGCGNEINPVEMEEGVVFNLETSHMTIEMSLPDSFLAAAPAVQEEEQEDGGLVKGIVLDRFRIRVIIEGQWVGELSHARPGRMQFRQDLDIDFVAMVARGEVYDLVPGSWGLKASYLVNDSIKYKSGEGRVTLTAGKLKPVSFRMRPEPTRPETAGIVAEAVWTTKIIIFEPQIEDEEDVIE